MSADLAAAIGLPDGAVEISFKEHEHLAQDRRCSVVVILQAGAMYRYFRLPEPRPALPTEPGSVVLATMVRGVRLTEPVLLHREAFNSPIWSSALPIDGRSAHRPENITDWTPAVVVPAERWDTALYLVRAIAHDPHRPGLGAKAIELLDSLPTPESETD